MEIPAHWQKIGRGSAGLSLLRVSVQYLNTVFKLSLVGKFIFTLETCHLNSTEMLSESEEVWSTFNLGSALIRFQTTGPSM